MILLPRHLVHRSMLALLLASCVAPVAALEFGTPKVLSRSGEPLLAEIPLTAQPGDRLEARCLQGHDPATAQLPVLRNVSFSLVGADANGRQGMLRLQTRTAITEPAVTLVVDADCGGGSVRREFVLLLAAPEAASARRPASVVRGSDWIVTAGESPRSLALLLYPGQPGVQQRFVRALAEANPQAAIDADGSRPLESGSVLHMPDWQMFGASRGASESSARADTGRQRASKPVLLIHAAPDNPEISAPPRLPRPFGAMPKVELEPQLRLSTQLGQSPVVDDKLRQALRLEYRLLIALNEQLSAASGAAIQSSLAAASLPGAAAATRPDETSRPAVLPATSSEAPVAPSVEPREAANKLPVETAPAVKIPKAAPPPPEPESDVDWLMMGGAGVGLVLLGWLFVRMRRRPLPSLPPSTEFLPTVMIHDEQPAAASEQTSVKAPATDLEAFFSTPDAASPPKLAATSTPVAEDPAAANPVMELAEIMLSFGRMQGAAQTLQEYIDANPNEALQPWVKLLDIYRSAEMRGEFETLAKRFNHNFNVEVQPWDPSVVKPSTDEAAVQKAYSLEDIPHIRDQITSLWGQPACLDYLHQLLHDNRGGQRSGFTLPVVQEILLLIDVLAAREA